MANVEKAVEGLVKCKKADEEKPKELEEDEKSPEDKKDSEEEKKKKEEEMEKMKKAIIEEVKKELAPQPVAKALDIPSVTTNNDKLEELHKQLGF